jgi:AcrR family transcriptional regulator
MAKRPYHHGDLRRALIDGAVELVREQGLSGWTLRGVARKVGVSHAAPYHHFADVQALLGAVTALGFGLLGERLTAAVDAAEGHEARLLAIARTYARFGAERPGLYQVMFREVRGEQEGTPEGREAGIEALSVLLREVVSAQEAGLVPPDVRPLTRVLQSWAMLHGFVGLAVLGPLPRMDLPLGTFDEQLEDVAQAAVRSVLRAD